MQRIRWLISIVVLSSHTTLFAAQTEASDVAALTSNVDTVAREWLASTGAPSVSIAIVRHGELAYAQAYGSARLDPLVDAVPHSRYAIDSLTKQFTAAAVLILTERGRLRLDDRVSRWFPALGEASNVTVHELLTHTSGIRDYWPQDFVTPEMQRATTPDALIQEWVKRPLDFAPGTGWQYSNTGYVLAARVVERASGENFYPFLQRNIFSRLGMMHVLEVTMPSAGSDAVGYTRSGLGPVHAALKEAPGWLFGAANLAMDPSDMARWDLSVMDRSLLNAASYASELAPVVLKDKTVVPYALGLDVERADGRLRIGHSGGGSGFLADNRLWPEDRAAIVVFTNNDWASPSELSSRIAFLLLTPSPAEARARAVFSALQNGSFDRRQFTAVGNTYFTNQVLADLHETLSPLGPMRELELEAESKRGGMITRHWKILCRDMRLMATERGYANGLLEEFIVTRRLD
jgi:CubicO group peptidase (beta-lactamase class C family)